MKVYIPEDRYQEVYDRYVGKINEYDDSIQVGGF